MRLPDFLCIGTYKAATTWLFDCLRQHPQVFTPDVKEVHFFNVRGGHDGFEEKGVTWYASLFEPGKNKDVLGDFTPGYLASPVAPARAALTVPDAKLIAILRNPAERAWSHYWYREAFGRQSQSLLEMCEAAAVDDESLLGLGLYARHLRRWRRHFDAEQLMVLLMEDIRESPEETYLSVCRFLGIDETFLPPEVSKRSNSARRLRSRTLYRLKHSAARFLYLSGADSVRRMVKSTGVTAIINRFNVVPEKNPPMPSQIRARLIEFYREDVRDLQSVLGRDLSSWLE